MCITLAGCSSPSSGAATATPTATSVPPTTLPLPTATAIPNPAVIPATPALSATTWVADPLNHDPTVVRVQGYMPLPHFVQTPDGFGHTLYAWHGICQGSADGYCQKMFFFIDTT